MVKGGSVYIMCSLNNSTLYTGIASDLLVRVQQHKSKNDPKSFTAKYNCIKLVYYKFYESIEAAIEEEKRIKAGSRAQKEALINSMNPAWKDLWEDIKDW